MNIICINHNRMKKLLLYIYFCLFAHSVFSQTYSWATTDTVGEYSEGSALAMDASGNLFAAVSYTPTGPRKGVYIIKYDVNHNLVWRQKLACIFFSRLSLATDSVGNVIFTSGFADSIFVNGTFITYSNTQSMLMIKFNSSGVFQFVKQTTGSSAWGMRVTTDAYNNIYVGGTLNDLYGDGINFDGTVINTPSIVYNFIAKYDSNGIFQWVKTGTGNSFSGWGIGMKTDASNYTYLCGTFFGTVYFDNLSVTSYGSQDIYIAKIDPQGNWLWLKHAGGANGSAQDSPRDLALDINGNPHITGFIGSATATFGTYTLTNTGEDDYFVAKYDASNGNVLWAFNGGGPGSQFGTGICVDNQGNTYVTRNVYFSRTDSNGNYLGYDTKAASNIAMVTDNNGCVYITGAIASSVTFNTTTLNPVNPMQMYVAKFCNSVITGITESQADNNFSVYPNPTTGKVSINCNNDIPLHNCTLFIKNTLGQIIYSEALKDMSGSFTKQVDLSYSQKGIYFVELQNNSFRSEVKKIIIQ